MLILLILSIAGNLKGQVLESDSSFEVLTLQIISLPEIKGQLYTDIFEDRSSIFIEADDNYIGLGQEVFNRSSSPPYFIWHSKTLFFHSIDYWLSPTIVKIDSTKAHYEFMTCSVTETNRTYFEGEVDFTLKNGIWIITNRRIKESKQPCLSYRKEKTTR